MTRRNIHALRWACLADLSDEGLRREVDNLKAFATLFELALNGPSVMNEDDLLRVGELLDTLVDDLDRSVQRVIDRNVCEIEQKEQQAAD